MVKQLKKIPQVPRNECSGIRREDNTKREYKTKFTKSINTAFLHLPEILCVLQNKKPVTLYNIEYIYFSEKSDIQDRLNVLSVLLLAEKKKLNYYTYYKNLKEPFNNANAYWLKDKYKKDAFILALLHSGKYRKNKLIKEFNTGLHGLYVIGHLLGYFDGDIARFIFNVGTDFKEEYFQKFKKKEFQDIKKKALNWIKEMKQSNLLKTYMRTNEKHIKQYKLDWNKVPKYIKDII